ncbi:MAG: copper resistance protein B [Gemmatimonadaceae bacterium]
MRRNVLRPLTIVMATLLALAGSRPVQAQADSSAALHEMRWGRTTFVASEVLEYLPSGADRPIVYDLVGWSGGASHRLWAKADGQLATGKGESGGAYQLLYGRMVSPYWDAQIGARADVQRDEHGTASRIGATVGLQGLAPGWFELEPSLFISTTGDVSLDLTASYDVYVTQRLVLQPRLEGSASFSDVPEFGVGSGLSEGAFALRARYEFRREFAPYAGVVWERRFGSTADLARAAGSEVGRASLVLGLRLWH